jgi:hypothetical protein
MSIAKPAIRADHLRAMCPVHFFVTVANSALAAQSLHHKSFQPYLWLKNVAHQKWLGHQ